MSAPSRVIELTPEDHDLCQTDETDGTKRFPVNRDIQEEIMEFIKKKLLDSIELQQFLVSREIDFHEKYIDSLANRDDQRNYNNHNDLEEHGQGEMSDEEKEKTLNYCRTQLIGLKKRLECLGRREQKACDYLSSPIRQLNILCSSETENHYKITNKSWITIVNSSITLQKIKLICEKLTEVEMEIEKIFWSTEVGNLVEKLEGSQKEVALEIILEMVNWASGISAKNNLVSLVRHLIDKSETREKVFKTLQQPNIAQFSVVEDYILSIKTYVAILLALKITDTIYRQKFGSIIFQLMTKTLEHSELRDNHLISIVEVFESNGQKLKSVLERFDDLLALIGTRTQILDISTQSRISTLMTLRTPSSAPLPLPVLAPIVTPSAPTSAVNVRHLTVIEHPNNYSMQGHSVVTKETMDALAKEIEQKVRMEMEKERRIADQRREELEKKNNEEKEREISLRKAREAQEKLRIEERKRQKEEQKARREEYNRNNRCTMFQGLTIFRHMESNETYSEGVFDGKIVGVYFSAHWCPPSRDFTPILRNFYSQVEDDFEILFVSSDQTKEEMIMYLEGYHGDWFHLPYNSQLGQYLSIQWEINSIPTLAIFKPNGTPIVRNARSLVENCQNPQQLINQWKSS